jgi:hypothetical protein
VEVGRMQIVHLEERSWRKLEVVDAPKLGPHFGMSVGREFGDYVLI